MATMGRQSAPSHRRPTASVVRSVGSKKLPQLLLWISLLCGPIQAAPSVESLDYGVSLFHFYQNDYFSALTELGAAAERNRLGSHTDFARLLEGGMLLSYGMDAQAEAAFNTLLNDEINTDQQSLDQTDSGEDNYSIDRDRIWFYVGKAAWQRGDVKRALTALLQVDTESTGQHTEEAAYLLASAHLALGNRTAASALLDDIQASSKWHYYLRYNLGASYASQGQWAEAAEELAHFTQMRTASEEAGALRDRGLTAAGYAKMSAGMPEAAIASFQQVRQESPQVERALLGYGWAAIQAKDYDTALTPWTLLAARSVFNENTREAMLALPFAYQKLDLPANALAEYEQAAAAYTSALAGIDNARRDFSSLPMTQLLGVSVSDEQDWLFELRNTVAPQHAEYLQHLVTRHAFKVTLRELRDLYGIQERLQRAQTRLQVLHEVDAHQSEVWKRVNTSDQLATLQARHQSLRQQRAVLENNLQRAIEASDSRALTTPEQIERWQSLQRARSLATSLNNTPEAAQVLNERLERIEGLLIWRDNEQFAQQRWTTLTALRELQTAEAATVNAIEAVAAAAEQQSEDNFESRIDMLLQRRNAISNSVALLTQENENQLRAMALEELERQESELVTALAQSRLAIAQIHDQALQDNWP